MHTARRLSEGGTLCTCGTYNCEGKHPRLSFSNSATSHKETVDSWYNCSREPPYGIAVHLGKSYAWVLDIDGEEGTEELSELLEKNGNLPETRVVASGSGTGAHYYFAGWVDKIHSGSLSKNIHIKGNAENAYVVAPPTLHVSGNRYQYLKRIAPFDAPRWLLDLVNNKTYSQAPKLSPDQLASRKNTEVSLSKLLSKEMTSSLHVEGSILRGSHPVHGSRTKRNFSIDCETNRWYCNRCKSYGGLFELAAMISGICKCEDFKRRVDDEIYIRPLQGKKFLAAIQFCIDSGIDS